MALRSFDFTSYFDLNKFILTLNDTLNFFAFDLIKTLKVIKNLKKKKSKYKVINFKRYLKFTCF